jgi:hypothetical protein
LTAAAPDLRGFAPSARCVISVIVMRKLAGPIDSDFFGIPILDRFPGRRTGLQPRIARLEVKQRALACNPPCDFQVSCHCGFSCLKRQAVQNCRSPAWRPMSVAESVPCPVPRLRGFGSAVLFTIAHQPRARRKPTTERRPRSNGFKIGRTSRPLGRVSTKRDKDLLQRSFRTSDRRELSGVRKSAFHK